MTYMKLGASLYVPACKMSAMKKVLEMAYPDVRSVILDTEDSILPGDLPMSYRNIRKVLEMLSEGSLTERPMVFLRVRNPAELRHVLGFEGIENLDGLVYPKFSVLNMVEYMSHHPDGMWYMPILENGIFDEKDLLTVREFLLRHQRFLLSVRIGITDLLSSLHTRRNGRDTIYRMPVAAHAISRIVCAFVPYGINVTGVISEHLGDGFEEVLSREAFEDLENGLFGKSAIHPAQVTVIQRAYRVSQPEAEAATRIMAEGRHGVFRLNDMMQECATHMNWAKRIISRMEIYGIQEEMEDVGVHGPR